MDDDTTIAEVGTGTDDERGVEVCVAVHESRVSRFDGWAVLRIEREDLDLRGGECSAVDLAIFPAQIAYLTRLLLSRIARRVFTAYVRV